MFDSGANHSGWATDFTLCADALDVLLEINLVIGNIKKGA
jgi:hypothetical protein